MDYIQPIYVTIFKINFFFRFWKQFRLQFDKRAIVKKKHISLQLSLKKGRDIKQLTN